MIVIDIILAKLVSNNGELDAVLEIENTIGVMHAIEGGHSLVSKDGDPIDNLKTLHSRGAVYMTLVHFYKNQFAHPVFPYPERVQKFGCFGGTRDLEKGRTDSGEQLVEEMCGLGMLVDVSHLTPKGRGQVFDIAEVDKQPIIATHVGVQGLGNDNPYNLADEEIVKIADSGGFVGVIFSTDFLGPEVTKNGIGTIVKTMRHLKNVGGIDVVAIGSDFDGLTDPPDDIYEASMMPMLTKALVGAGFTADELKKILGGNVIQTIRQGWGKT